MVNGRELATKDGTAFNPGAFCPDSWTKICHCELLHPAAQSMLRADHDGEATFWFRFIGSEQIAGALIVMR